eukprot:5378715-Amphidinium_carterae.1
MISSTGGVGRWSERSRFTQGRDIELMPLAIIRMSTEFSNTMESQSWQQGYCPTVISDWEEIYEADAPGSTVVPRTIWVNMFNHSCGHKVRATLSTHNPQLWASIQHMMANMMMSEVLNKQGNSQVTSQSGHPPQSWTGWNDTHSVN